MQQVAVILGELRLRHEEPEAEENYIVISDEE